MDKLRALVLERIWPSRLTTEATGNAQELISWPWFGLAMFCSPLDDERSLQAQHTSQEVILSSAAQLDELGALVLEQMWLEQLTPRATGDAQAR